MNTLTIGALWGAVHVTLFLSIGCLAHVAMRRLAPGGGAAAALGCLLLSVGLSLAAMTPWPSWWTVRPAGEDIAEAVSETTTTSVETHRAAVHQDASGDAESGRPAPRLAAEEDVGRAFLAGLWDGMQVEEAGARPEVGRWPTAAALVIVAGVLVGFGRLVVGLAAVVRYRRTARTITDPRVRDVMGQLRGRMPNLGPLAIRESSMLTAPATVGWRRPLVLLPSNWREWTDAELRTVLTHEAAHVERCDYLCWLAAQVSVVLHFYHPLVHWLARRLRLEQELAADARAARILGGTEQYVFTLAGLALRQDDQRMTWAARPFLPERGALLRRIDMLRDHRCFERSLAARRVPRLALILGLMLAAVAVAGLRAPGRAAPPERVGAAPQADADVTSVMSYVPADAAAVVVAKPSELAERPELKSAFEKLLTSMDVGEVGLPAIDQWESAVVVVNLEEPGQAAPRPGVILRTRDPYDWRAFAARLVPNAKSATAAGQDYFKSAEAGNPYAYFLPDARTIILDVDALMIEYLLRAGRGAPSQPWVKTWDCAGDAPLRAMVQFKVVGRAIRHGLLQSPSETVGIVDAFAPLWEDMDVLVASVSAGESLKIDALAECPSDAASERVRQTAGAALTLAGNGLAKLRENAAEMSPGAGFLLDAVRETLDTAVLRTEGPLVKAEMKSSIDLALGLQLLAPALTSARTSARRAQSMNNLKQIALAMHVYHDANGRFPPAVVMGPDGRTPHSWRVAILPYLEQQALHDQYRFDEAWDSPHNLRVAANMPPVFRSSLADNAMNSSYFVFTGEDTPFPPGHDGMKLRDILDGTSNTLMVVEAKRDIPWTKPEDIAYDRNAPLPKLDGYYPGLILAAFMDGSARGIPSDFEENNIRGMITPTGRERIHPQP